MKKYILTKDFVEIARPYGIFQNLSGDANIEITNNTNEQGILLKPFQQIQINQRVYARKVTGSGTAQLIILPFRNDPADGIFDSDDYPNFENPFDENFNRPKKNHCHDNSTDWRRPPPPPMFDPFDKEPEVVDCGGFYMLRVPKDSLNGQNKFLVQINEPKGND